MLYIYIYDKLKRYIHKTLKRDLYKTLTKKEAVAERVGFVALTQSKKWKYPLLGIGNFLKVFG